jgi:hypothetical protein
MMMDEAIMSELSGRLEGNAAAGICNASCAAGA